MKVSSQVRSEAESDQINSIMFVQVSGTWAEGFSKVGLSLHTHHGSPPPPPPPPLAAPSATDKQQQHFKRHDSIAAENALAGTEFCSYPPLPSSHDYHTPNDGRPLPVSPSSSEEGLGDLLNELSRAFTLSND